MHSWVHGYKNKPLGGAREGWMLLKVESRWWQGPLGKKWRIVIEVRRFLLESSAHPDNTSSEYQWLVHRNTRGVSMLQTDGFVGRLTPSSHTLTPTVTATNPTFGCGHLKYKLCATSYHLNHTDSLASKYNAVYETHYNWKQSGYYTDYRGQ